MRYQDFVVTLAQVSQEKYGVPDSLARLVYFKIVRFAKTSVRQSGGQVLTTSHAQVILCVLERRQDEGESEGVRKSMCE